MSPANTKLFAAEPTASNNSQTYRAPASTQELRTTQTSYGEDACYASLHQSGTPAEICIDALELAKNARNSRQSAEISSALAMVYAKKGQLPNARDLMDKALAAQPGSQIVRVNNGNLAIYEGNYEQALLEFDSVLSVSSPPAVYLNRSIALRALGRYADAKRDYESFLALRNMSNGSIARDPAGSRVPGAGKTNPVPIEDRSSTGGGTIR